MPLTDSESAPVILADVWTKLSAPLPDGAIQWRQSGRPKARGNGFVAQFVAYIDANTVQARLDDVVPGAWALALEPLPETRDEFDHIEYHFRASLTVFGLTRDDVGSGRSRKAAATDAFKRAAVRFGIGRELYVLPPNWVPMDGDGKYAKPVIDPQANMDQYHGLPSAFRDDEPARGQPYVSPAVDPLGRFPGGDADDDEGAGIDLAERECPKCGGPMWDNRESKRNPKAPDFKCKDRACDGVIWPPKGAARHSRVAAKAAAPPTTYRDAEDDDSIPF